ncbi:MAG: hypothetical protein IPK04_20370 [Bdellovibrionales bacterium]|nr:hypothetical protein [Bdellovibrionales bacterium]
MRKVIMVMLLLISNTAFSGVCLIDTISKVTYVNSVEVKDTFIYARCGAKSENDRTLTEDELLTFEPTVFGLSYNPKGASENQIKQAHLDLVGAMKRLSISVWFIIR